MIVSSLSSTLADLSSHNPDQNVAAIKTSVANYLHEADPSAIVETTEYFNHTFSPDIVLRWRDEGSGVRPVYIRTDAREASLREDLEYLPDESPFCCHSPNWGPRTVRKVMATLTS